MTHRTSIRLDRAERRAAPSFVSLACLLIVLAASPVAAERMALPIANPGQPVRLEVSVPNASIEVRGTATQEVVVVFNEEGADGSGEPEKVDGMYRIPNRSFGLTAEVDGNDVEIQSGWGRELVIQIEVPRRTSMTLQSVSGDTIVVRDVEGDLELNCTNGNIEATGIHGSVVAHSTNGDIRVELLGLGERKPMSFITFNGDIDVTFPAGFASDLRMSSMQGDIFSDFELAIQASEPQIERDEGRVKYRVEKEVRARLGGGGEETRFKTWNGDIYVRRAGAR